MQDMTDGCGLMNIVAARMIMEALELDELPVAVQVRVGGAKVGADSNWSRDGTHEHV